MLVMEKLKKNFIKSIKNKIQWPNLSLSISLDNLLSQSRILKMTQMLTATILSITTQIFISTVMLTIMITQTATIIAQLLFVPITI